VSQLWKRGFDDVPEVEPVSMGRRTVVFREPERPRRGRAARAGLARFS
jgi:hypothetical protein